MIEFADCLLAGLRFNLALNLNLDFLQLLQIDSLRQNTLNLQAMKSKIQMEPDETYSLMEKTLTFFIFFKVPILYQYCYNIKFQLRHLFPAVFNLMK